MVVIVGFLQVAAINEKDAIPNGLGPEVAERFFGEDCFFPIALVRDGKDEAIHGEPAADQTLPDIAPGARIADFAEELADVDVNLIAESAVVVGGFFGGVRGADE